MLKNRRNLLGEGVGRYGAKEHRQTGARVNPLETVHVEYSKRDKDNQINRYASAYTAADNDGIFADIFSPVFS